MSALLLALAITALGLGLWLYRSGERERRLAQRVAQVCTDQREQVQSAALFIAAQKKGLWYGVWQRFEVVLGAQHARMLLLVTALGLLLCAVLGPRYLQPWQELIALVVILVQPLIWLQWVRNKQLRAFESSFPVALDLISRAVGTGSSIQQAFDYVAQQVPGQVGGLFAQLVDQLRIGVTMQAALEDACQRITSRKLRYFSVAVVLNLESGGQLSEVLQKLSREIQQQRTREQKLIAMTAEPRSSARIVALIPVFVLVFFYFFSPQHITVLLTDPLGQLIAMYAVSSIVLGLLVIEKMTRVNSDE
ncbi:MAG: type II secretion system F family protein [Pseudomonadales bacterium]